MDPISWILSSILLVSSGGNWYQYNKINNKAQELHEVNKRLQIQKVELQNKDKKLLQSEIRNKKATRRFKESLQNNTFIIYSQASQLAYKNPDKYHKLHKATTKKLSNSIGTPNKIATTDEVWDSKYLTKIQRELIAAKVEKEQSVKEAEELRKELRKLQKAQVSVLDELDVKSTQLVAITSQKAGLLSQFNSWIKYAIYGGILWGLITLYGFIKGFWIKFQHNKYKQIIRTFGIKNEDGNNTLASLLEEKGLEIPSILKKS